MHHNPPSYLQAVPFAGGGPLGVSAESVGEPPEEVEEGLGAGDDVEGGRHRASVLEVTHPQAGTRELPFRVCIVLCRKGQKRMKIKCHCAYRKRHQGLPLHATLQTSICSLVLITASIPVTKICLMGLSAKNGNSSSQSFIIIK